MAYIDCAEKHKKILPVQANGGTQTHTQKKNIRRSSRSISESLRRYHSGNGWFPIFALRTLDMIDATNIA